MTARAVFLSPKRRERRTVHERHQARLGPDTLVVQAGRRRARMRRTIHGATVALLALAETFNAIVLDEWGKPQSDFAPEPVVLPDEWKGVGPVGSKSHIHRLEKGYLDATVQERETGGEPQRVPPLNPGFVEWLMGYPFGWTAVDDPRPWHAFDAAAPLDLDPWADGEWEGVPRVLADVDDRVARLRCLGNAVVPQVVAHVAEVIHRNRLAGDT